MDISSSSDGRGGGDDAIGSGKGAGDVVGTDSNEGRAEPEPDDAGERDLSRTLESWSTEEGTNQLGSDDIRPAPVAVRSGEVLPFAR